MSDSIINIDYLRKGYMMAENKIKTDYFNKNRNINDIDNARLNKRLKYLKLSNALSKLIK